MEVVEGGDVGFRTVFLCFLCHSERSTMSTGSFEWILLYRME
jgi:hypothetical protein